MNAQKYDILIFGGSGQLGRSLNSRLVDSGLTFKTVESSDCRIEDSTSVTRLMENYQPSIIINCAAWTDVNAAEIEPLKAEAINAGAVRNLVEAAIKYDSILVHISTDYVYANGHKFPIDENATTIPLNKYGESKLAGENEICMSGLASYYIIRTSWLYSEYGSNFVKTILRKARHAEAIEVVDDQIGTPTSANELAEAIINLVKIQPKFGIYNYSCEGECSWFTFAQEIYQIAGLDVKLVRAKKSDGKVPIRPSYSVLSKEKWVNAGLPAPKNWLNVFRNEFPAINSAKGKNENF